MSFSLKNKLLFVGGLGLVILMAIFVYALQFSALSYQLECSRLSNQCILSRKMVVGGIKKDFIALDQIRKADITLHSQQQSNVWLITDRQNYPLGTFSSQTSEANRLLNAVNSYLYEAQEESFSYQSSSR